MQCSVVCCISNSLARCDLAHKGSYIVFFVEPDALEVSGGNYLPWLDATQGGGGGCDTDWRDASSSIPVEIIDGATGASSETSLEVSFLGVVRLIYAKSITHSGYTFKIGAANISYLQSGSSESRGSDDSKDCYKCNVSDSHFLFND